MSNQDKIQTALLLEKAANFDPSQWTQHAHARNKAGNPTKIQDPNAIQFCAIGILIRTAEEESTIQNKVSSATLFFAVSKELPEEGDITEWNDQPNRNPQQVRKLFLRAAKQLRKENSQAVTGKTYTGDAQAGGLKDPNSPGLL